MIPKGQIIHWRQYAPWLEDNQVEQDLIISRAEFEQNLHRKRRNKGFRTDVDSLLSPEIDWSFDDAMDAVLSEFIPKFPGDPWEGGD